MSSSLKVVPVEQEDLDARILETSRTQLINEKKMILTDDGHYVLTEKGRDIARKELARYDFRPNMAIMIQQYILEINDISVY